MAERPQSQPASDVGCYPPHWIDAAIEGRRDAASIVAAISEHPNFWNAVREGLASANHAPPSPDRIGPSFAQMVRREICRAFDDGLANASGAPQPSERPK